MEMASNPGDGDSLESWRWRWPRILEMATSPGDGHESWRWPCLELWWLVVEVELEKIRNSLSPFGAKARVEVGLKVVMVERKEW
jgi:hypothetical protein